MIGKQILTYRIESLIGKGGMGSVYLASNLHIAEKVAIKVLNSEFAENPAIRERFKDEAKSLLALNHQHIVKFINFYENDEGQLFIIMEYVDGITLESFLNDKNGLLVEERAYPIFEQILVAIGYAHKQGIVHRDIKPANIILTSDNEGNFVAKILDFGIAKILSEDNEKEKGWVVGTLLYMSPEQVEGKYVDKRSDIYSLGVLLHQMLTGRAPYDSTTLLEYEIEKRVVNDPLPRMREYYSAVSDKAQKVVDKATAKDPDKRHQSCSDFSKAWTKAVIGEKIPPLLKYAAAVIIILLLGGGFWFWDYNRLKVDYYKDYVEVFGVPKGIGKADYKSREKTYKFEYKQGKLRHLALVNSKGNVVEDGESERIDRPINAEFVYTSNSISYVRYLDRNNKPLYRKTYHETNGKIDKFIYQYDNSVEKYLPQDLSGYTRYEDDGAEKSRISRFALEFDKNGFVSSLHYQNRDGDVTGDNQHVYGKRYERDEKGRVKTEYYLASNDSVTATNWGLGIKKFEYDNKNNLIKCTYLSPNGLPALDTKDGIELYELEYDKYGNLTYGWHKTADGSLMLPKKHQRAGTKYKYNDHGQVIEVHNLGLDKEIAYSKGCFGIKWEYDEKGYVSRQTYIDEKGEPFVYLDGSVIQTVKNDSKGNPLEVSYFDADNKPMEITGGYAKYIAEYDSLGNQTSIFHYGSTDSLCITTDGYAGIRYVYNNEKNKVTSLTIFGVDNQPVENSNGVVIVKYDYNAQGNQTKLAYYDADGQTLKLSNEGIAGRKSKYDDNGNETKREFFDEKGNLTAGSLGYAQIEYIYDKEHGYLLETKNLNKTGNLIFVRSDGYAGVKYKRDARGNMTEKLPYDTNGRLVAGKYIERKKYDDRDNVIERSYFDANGNKTLQNGYHKLVSKYDERNQETEASVYGINGEFINTPQGYATMKVKRDNRGNITEYATYNTSQQLVTGTSGYAVRKIEYDAMNREIRETYLDANEKPVNPSTQIPELKYGYDKWGNKNYFAHADGKRNLINHPKYGYAYYRSEFDIRGNNLSQSYYDKNDKPYDREGYYKNTYTYDKNGNLLESRYYAADDSLRKESYAIERNKYDEQGNLFERRYYGADENLRKNDYAIERRKYNEQRKLIERTFFNYLDKAIDYNNVAHKFVYSYDEQGNYLYLKRYKVNGSLDATMKWNEQTGWEFVQNNSYTSDSSSSSSDKSWQEYWKQIAQNCPETVSNEIEISSVSIQSTGCVVTIRFLQISKYNITDLDLQTKQSEILELAKNLKSKAGMPNNTTLTFICVDKAKRELYRKKL